MAAGGAVALIKTDFFFMYVLEIKYVTDLFTDNFKRIRTLSTLLFSTVQRHERPLLT